MLKVTKILENLCKIALLNRPLWHHILLLPSHLNFVVLVLHWPIHYCRQLISQSGGQFHQQFSRRVCLKVGRDNARAL